MAISPHFADLLAGKITPEESIERALAWAKENDWLGKAAEARRAFREAFEAGEMDKAWAMISLQKQHYLKHAQLQGFTQEQTLALDGSCSLLCEEVLRAEGKFLDALVHAMYAISTHSRPSKRELQRLKRAHKACKFPTVTLEEVEAQVEAFRGDPNFRAIQNAVRDWDQRGAKINT